MYFFKIETIKIHFHCSCPVKYFFCKGHHHRMELAP